MGVPLSLIYYSTRYRRLVRGRLGALSLGLGLGVRPTLVGGQGLGFRV